MDNNTLRKIIEDRIASLEGQQFQDFCDRLNSALYGNDYDPTRAAGRSGDMKCDGYCPTARIFFAAHATRGEAAAATKAKIKSDLEGCLTKQRDVRTWRYLTNDTLLGEVQAFVDTLRPQHPDTVIEVWGHKTIANNLVNLDRAKIETVLDMHFGPPSTDVPVLDMTWVGASGGANGHFETLVVKNIGRSTAMDCRVSIVGDNYEWSANMDSNVRDVEAGQQLREIIYPIDGEPTFHDVVPNLKVVMEYKDVLGHSLVTTRGVEQILVQSGSFYNLKRTDDFGAPTQIERA